MSVSMMFNTFSKVLGKTALLASLLLLLPAVAPRAQTVDRVVAVINDDVITLSELLETGGEYIDRVVASAPEDQRQQAREEAKKRVLTKMIDQRLVSQQAEKAGITVSDEELDQSYRKKLAEMGLDREEFLAKLNQSGMSEEKFLEDLRSQLLRDKLVLYEIRSKIIVTDDMIRDYYKAEYAPKGGTEGYHLQQIGISWTEDEQLGDSGESLEEEKTRARKRAESIRAQLAAGADFATLARKESDLPSAVDGGDLGIFARDELAGYMRKAILALEPGEITPVLETPNGYQIFRLLAKLDRSQEGDGPPEALKEKIRRELFEKQFNEEFRAWVEEIKEGAYVKNML